MVTRQLHGPPTPHLLLRCPFSSFNVMRTLQSRNRRQQKRENLSLVSNQAVSSVASAQGPWHRTNTNRNLSRQQDRCLAMSTKLDTKNNTCCNNNLHVDCTVSHFPALLHECAVGPFLVRLVHFSSNKTKGYPLYTPHRWEENTKIASCCCRTADPPVSRGNQHFTRKRNTFPRK